jgi:hypothetical protein
LRSAPAILAVVLLAACGTTGGEQQPVPLPPEIAPAVARACPGRTVVSHEARQTASGRIHTVVLRDGDFRTDLELNDAGEILRERAELRESEAPLEILGAARREFPDARIPLVVRWRRHGDIHYEIRIIDTTGIRSSLAITTGGMIVEDMDGVGEPADR